MEKEGIPVDHITVLFVLGSAALDFRVAGF